MLPINEGKKNYAAIVNFEQKSKIVRLNVHYLVPRIDENSAWMVDETADDFLPMIWSNMLSH